MGACLTTVAICLLLSTGQPEAGPTAGEVLQAYTRALDATRSFVSQAEIVSHQDFEFDANFDPHSFGTNQAIKALGLVSRMGVEFHTDGIRTRRIQYAWGDLGFYAHQKNVPETQPQYNFVNWDGREFCAHSSTANDPAKRGIVQIGGLEKDGAPGLFTRHSESYILGYHSDERVDRVLRGAEGLSVAPRMEKIGDANCYVLKSETDRDAISLWIDPEHGYHTAQAETRRVTGDLRRAKTVRTTRLENVRFEEIDGVWVPMEADILEECFFDVGGKKGHTRAKHHYRRTQFVLDPDHDRLGSFDKCLETNPELLDGTPVCRDDDPQTYVWRDGKVVPHIGASGSRSKGQRRVRESGRRRTRYR